MSQLGKWRGRSALVVDDSATNLALAVQILQAIGFDPVYEANNGLAALGKLHKIGHIDLVLTDLNMPGMDGIELLETLERTITQKSFFVAVMSSVPRDVLDTVQNIADASKLDLAGVVAKPLSLDNVKTILDAIDPDFHRTSANGSGFVATLEDMEAALNAGQFVPYFQPKVSIADRSLAGVEVLVRWNHPEHGILPPSDFVHFLESGNVALRFFYQFFKNTCEALQGFPIPVDTIHCSINLPVPLLLADELVEKMENILAEHQLPTHAIILELTETSLMSNLAPSLSTLARLRMKGFGVAMDDYGTGYSSMKQLSRVPFTELKIDREFVHDAANSNKKLAILTTAISMSQRLKMVSVAEGVETESDWQQLAALGCDLAQGYHISRPLPFQQFIEWYNARTQSPDNPG